MTQTATTRAQAASAHTPAPREVDVIGIDGKKSGTATLPGEIFDVQVNIPLIHQVVVAQLAAARQGTHSTKTRGEVRGGGRKPYRQKGTGRARQGSTRAPQFVGGGVVHGPTPRNYEQRTPKKMKAAALRGALSDRARSGRVHVVSGLIDSDAPSTKAAVLTLANLSQRRHVLVVVSRSDLITWKSLRNAASIHLLGPDQLNTYDVLVSDDVVFTSEALDQFVAGPARGKSATAVAREDEVPTAKETEPPAKKAAAKKTTAKKAAAAEPAAEKPAAKKTAAKETAEEKPAVEKPDDSAGVTADEPAAKEDDA